MNEAHQAAVGIDLGTTYSVLAHGTTLGRLLDGVQCGRRSDHPQPPSSSDQDAVVSRQARGEGCGIRASLSRSACQAADVANPVHPSSTVAKDSRPRYYKLWSCMRDETPG